uniref:Uncharacterized protein n=1 Tax=Brassica campestris TaxID=3711 RepID=M4EU05_BRACM
MSVRMLPVACAATHGAHMAGCMSGSHARRHTSSHMSGCMTELHARHHTSSTWLAACSGCMAATPCAPTCLTACSGCIHRDILCFSRHIPCKPVSSRFRSHASGHLVLLGPFIRF